jgi:transglutaminase-like putative cysteine protease
MNLEPDEQRKWEFLRDVPLRDATSSEHPGNDALRQVALSLATVAMLSPWPQWCFATLALALARDCVTYQLDSDRLGREQIDGWPPDPYVSPLEPFTRGVDDCDAKARLFVALCLCRNIRAEVVPRKKGSQLAHIYARAFCQGPGEHAPRWYLAETILRRARLGDIAEQVPKEIDTGKWLF